jgi:hypothetical protein
MTAATAPINQPRCCIAANAIRTAIGKEVQPIQLGGFDAMSLNQRIALLDHVIPFSNIQVSR